MVEKNYTFSKGLISRTFGFVAVFFVLLTLGWGLFFPDRTDAQAIAVAGTSPIFRIGEKLTYNISYG